MKIKFLLILAIAFSKVIISQTIWEPTSGPNILDLADFDISPNNTLVVSATNSGIFLSYDHGLSWQKKSNGLNRVDSYATSLAAGSDNTIYAIIDGEFCILNSNSSVWEKTAYKFPMGSKVVSNELGFIYVLTLTLPSELLISKDHGKTFENILKNTSFAFPRSYSLNGNGMNFFLVRESSAYNVYQVNDNGSELKKIYSTTVDYSSLAWHPLGYLFISDIIGNLTRINILNSELKKSKLNAPVTNVTPLVIRPDGNLIYFAEDGDYKSEDLGETWNKTTTEFYKKMQHGYTFLIHNDDTYLFKENCFDVELIYTSDEGKTWSSFDEYFSNPDGVYLNYNAADILITHTCAFGRYAYSVDKGKNWQALNLPDIYPMEGLFESIVSSANGVLIVKDDSELYRSQDFGNSWVHFSFATIGVPTVNWVVGDHNNLIYVSGIPYSFITTNGGVDWNQVQSQFILLDAILKHPDGTLIGNSGNYGILRYSEDNGIHWNETKMQFKNINSMYVSGNGDIYLDYAELKGHGSGLYVTHDKFESVEHLSGETFISIVACEDETLYGVTNYRLCKKSNDGGRTWNLFTNGLPLNYKASSLALDSDQYLYVSLINDVVYKTAEPACDQVYTNVKTVIDKNRIHPNPANEEINILLTKNINYPLHWQLVNTYSQSILSGDIKSEKSVINVQVIPNGIYFLKFGDPKIPIQKIVVQH